MSGGGVHSLNTKPIKQEVLLQAIKERFLIAPPIVKEKNLRADTAIARMNDKIAEQVPRISAALPA